MVGKRPEESQRREGKEEREGKNREVDLLLDRRGERGRGGGGGGGDCQGLSLWLWSRRRRGLSLWLPLIQRKEGRRESRGKGQESGAGMDGWVSSPLSAQRDGAPRSPHIYSHYSLLHSLKRSSPTKKEI